MQVRLHSNLDGSSLAHAIQVPMGPLHYFRIILELERERTKEEKEREEVLHLFRCYTHTQDVYFYINSYTYNYIYIYIYICIYICHVGTSQNARYGSRPRAHTRSITPDSYLDPYPRILHDPYP